MQMIHQSERNDVVLIVGASGGDDKLELVIPVHFVEHCVAILVRSRFKCKSIVGCFLTHIIPHMHCIHGNIDYKRLVFICCVYLHDKGFKHVWGHFL